LLAQQGSGYRHIEEWGWEFRPPNGESPREVLDRLLPWVTTLSRDTVAVCHIGIMRMLLARATGWNFDGPAPFRIKRDRLFVLTIDGARWQLEDAPVRLETRPE
jgi:probable phosphoglycerate mutase